jgi:tRNA 2-thiocytidine biosynthesis protein TtcA
MDFPIARPPWTKLGKKLESIIRKALFDYQMLNDTKKIAIALSGGKDSLTLLFMLKAISGKGFPHFDLHAIHVSGAYTCGSGVNLDFIKGMCDQLEVPLTIREAYQSLDSLECYSCSRTRRKLLFDAAKEVGAYTIAFGHHRDDNAQTVLMNILHKAEFAGQLPKIQMHDFGVTIIRPLIYVAEKDIQTFAQQHGFSRITCQCPVGQDSMRRHVDRLLEDIELLYPNARSNLSNAALEYGSKKAEIR